MQGEPLNNIGPREVSMSSFNLEAADVRFLRRVFAVLVFAAVTSLSGTVLALLTGPGFPS
jgi:hypothetical protein